MIGVEDKPGVAFCIFDVLAKEGINVDIILQSVGRDGTKDISFTVAAGDLEPAVALLEQANISKKLLPRDTLTELSSR